MSNSPDKPNKALTELLTNQMSKIFNSGDGSKDDHGEQLQAMTEVMTSIQPQDAIEQMLVTQLVAAHNATMECFAEAMTEDAIPPLFGDRGYKHSSEVRNMFLRTAGKLTNCSVNLLDALSRHRGKCTEQKITVQYVTVSNGGQAIIGSIERGDNQNGG